MWDGEEMRAQAPVQSPSCQQLPAAGVGISGLCVGALGLKSQELSTQL